MAHPGWMEAPHGLTGHIPPSSRGCKYSFVGGTVCICTCHCLSTEPNGSVVGLQSPRRLILGLYGGGMFWNVLECGTLGPWV